MVADMHHRQRRTPSWWNPGARRHVMGDDPEDAREGMRSNNPCKAVKRDPENGRDQ